MLRGVEVAIDHRLVRVGAVVFHEGGDLFGSRGKPREVEGHSSDESLSIRFRSGCQAGGFKPGEHEGIDRISNPGLIRDLGDRRAFQRLPCPPVAAEGDVRAIERGIAGVGADPVGPGGTFEDPLGDDRQFRLGKDAGRGHRVFVALPRNHLEDQALFWIALIKCRATVASAKQCLSRVESEAAFGPALTAVTSQARPFDDRPGLGFEELRTSNDVFVLRDREWREEHRGADRPEGEAARAREW